MEIKEIINIIIAIIRIEIIKAVESHNGDKTQIHCQFIALKIFNKIKIKVKNPKNAEIVFKIGNFLFSSLILLSVSLFASSFSLFLCFLLLQLTYIDRLAVKISGHVIEYNLCSSYHRLLGNKCLMRCQ